MRDYFAARIHLMSLCFAWLFQKLYVQKLAVTSEKTDSTSI